MNLKSELDNETNYTYFGARYYDSDLSSWLSVDPLASERSWLSPYNYCQNNPMNRVDPTGALDVDDLEVTKNKNGTYTVVGGTANSDKNIYVIGNDNKPTGEVIGEMLTEYSFHNAEGNAVMGAVIDLNDNSGQEFFDTEIQNKNHGLISYAKNATRNAELDFKNVGVGNIPSQMTKEQHHFRGMPFDGKIASATDIGNYSAGYVVGNKGFGWLALRGGFDGYNSIDRKKISFEPPTSTRAQKLGYERGYNSFTSPMTNYPNPSFRGK